eukprot:TRINITY_DN585_c0_g3_i1.p1 TRINITY_DN585_c0_g3~~TRINITY_DN585_c0_g3_i1.p1  ORF type:complete len:613 (+),score=178.78 TRINITY_DN585_c0_g3_i1:183-1841(+)
MGDQNDAAESAALVRRSSKATNEGFKPEDCPYGIKCVLAIFMLVNFVAYFDRGAIAGALSTIKDDPDIAGNSTLSDTQAGALVSAFMVGFMVCSPPFATLGGYAPPSYIVASGLFMWIIACLGTSLSADYPMLVCARCLVGIGEAAYCGFIPAMIDDMAPAASRTFFIGMYFAMIPTGMAVGMAAGGVFGGVDEIAGFKGWKFVFFMQSLTMVPLVLLILRLPHSLGRGRAEPVEHERMKTAVNPQESDETGSNGSWTAPASQFNVIPNYPHPWEALKALLTNKQFMLTTLGYGMYTFVLGGASTWGITFLEQGQLKMSQASAALAFGMTTAFTGLLGTAIGGWYVDHLGGSKGLVGMMHCHKFNVMMVIISVPTGLFSFMMEQEWAFFTLCFVAELSLFTTTAPLNSLIMESVGVNMRTYAMAFCIFVIHAVGDFPSPVLVGAVSDHFSNGCNGYSGKDNATQFACIADVEHSCMWVDDVCRNKVQLRNAMVFLFALLILAPVFWGVALLLLRAEMRSAYTEVEDDRPVVVSSLHHDNLTKDEKGDGTDSE